MVKDGDFVVINYTGTLDDGDVFDTSVDREPFEFQVGTGSVIPGLDKAVIGMKINEEKDIVIEPEEAYGFYDEEMVLSFPLREVKSQFEPQVGMTIGVQLDNGRQVPAMITNVTEEAVIIDMNHPMSGKTLHFHLSLVEINQEAKYSTQGGCECCDPGSECSC
jgi:peptidylprolyl isomerase